MTDLLDFSADDAVLEIGTGLGYQAAILAELAREVYSIEVIEELGQQAKAGRARFHPISGPARASKNRPIRHAHDPNSHGEWRSAPPPIDFDALIFSATGERAQFPAHANLRLAAWRNVSSHLSRIALRRG